jgi:ectoine hydroxylase-related dioxygenase (phytanoyl-CoA dioxygenase family)
VSELSVEQIEQLAREGYLVLRRVLAATVVDHLRLRLEERWAEESHQAGVENYIEQGARRLANLANKGDCFRQLVVHATILPALEAVIGPHIRLSMLNARDALPYTGHDQPLHCDTDRGEKPDANGYNACTVIWMLDDFTRGNGATRLVAGSHHSLQTPKEAGVDLYAPHPNEVVIEGRAGDVLVFNGHCWHAGGRNQTGASRRAILAHYRRGDIVLAEHRRQRLSPAVASRLTPLERAILGVDEAKD